MDRFTDALISKYTLKIPKEDDWFAPLLGDWDIRYCVSTSDNSEETKGEWFFRRILDGIGIQDILLCSSLTPEANTAVRIYHPFGRCYVSTYTYENMMPRLIFKKDGRRLIGTNPDNPKQLHIFSEIQNSSFRWNLVIVDDNQNWHIGATIFAVRKRA